MTRDPASLVLSALIQWLPVPVNGAPTTVITPHTTATAPPHLANSQTGFNVVPPSNLPSLHDSYGPHRSTLKETVSLISKHYARSAEITHAAQLPPPVENHVDVTDFGSEQLDEPMPSGDNKELNAMYDLRRRLMQTNRKMQSTATHLIKRLKSAEARHSYKSRMFRLELQKRYNKFSGSIRNLLVRLHDVRYLTRIGRGIEAPFRPGPHYLHKKETSSAMLQQYLALETVCKVLASQVGLILAYKDLRTCHRNRQIKPFYEKDSNLIRILFKRFAEVHAYKDSVEAQLSLDALYASARRTHRSLCGLLRAFHSWRKAKTNVSRAGAGGPNTARLFENEVFMASSDNLRAALVGLIDHGVWKTARDRKLSPNIRTECEGSARSDPPFEHALARQAVHTGQEVVRKPGMVGSGYKSLGLKSKDQIQIISAQSRCYCNQGFQPNSERSKAPSALHDYSYTSQAHRVILQPKQETAGITKRQSTRDIPQVTHMDEANFLEELPQSSVSAAAKHTSSHSPKGFAMSCSEVKSNTNENSTVQPVNWSYALYAGPKNERVKVHYCKNKVDTERIAQLFRDEDVIGFDIEWKPNAQAKDGIKQNVSLIQLASEERVALFHIARYRDQESLEGLVAPTLKAIMESSHITKAGVGIKADCTRLHRFLGIESRGLFELSHLYKLVKYSGGDTRSINKKLVRLAMQVEEHLGLPLSKGGARVSDWSLALDLNQVQCS